MLILKPVSDREILREKLQKDVADYLAKGGEITTYTAYDNAGYRMKKFTRQERIQYLKGLFNNKPDK